MILAPPKGRNRVLKPSVPKFLFSKPSMARAHSPRLVGRVFTYSVSHMRSPLKFSRPLPSESPCISRLFWVHSTLGSLVKVAVNVISAECWVLLRAQDFNPALLSSPPFRAPSRKLKSELNPVSRGGFVKNARSYFAVNFVVADTSSLVPCVSAGPQCLLYIDIWRVNILAM